MIEGFPIWINIFFILVSIATIFLFHLANGKPTRVTLLISFWAICISFLAYCDFFTVADTIPPRFVFIIIPVIIAFIYGYLPHQKKWILAHRDTRTSTILHTVRLPVEITLLFLFMKGQVPELMTFEGRNFDILAGISAPLMGILLARNIIGNKILLIWNYIGLFLVTFIVVNAILSAETPIQQFAFDQPNKGIAFFPFILLPALIAPIVIHTHLMDIMKIKQELRVRKTKK